MHNCATQHDAARHKPRDRPISTCCRCAVAAVSRFHCSLRPPRRQVQLRGVFLNIDNSPAPSAKNFSCPEPTLLPCPLTDVTAHGQYTWSPIRYQLSPPARGTARRAVSYRTGPQKKGRRQRQFPSCLGPHTGVGTDTLTHGSTDSKMPLPARVAIGTFGGWLLRQSETQKYRSHPPPFAPCAASAQSPRTKKGAPPLPRGPPLPPVVVNPSFILGESKQRSRAKKSSRHENCGQQLNINIHPDTLHDNPK